jgi:16S rRNA (cytosine967-C5)-methyltransferase
VTEAGIGVAERAAAALAIAGVLGRGRTLEVALADRDVVARAGRARAAVQALAYGAIRFAPRLERAVERLLARPWTEQGAEQQALLLLGLFQLEYGNVPAHAAVSTTVAAARALGLARAAGFVNAVLRRYGRERAECLAAADRTMAGRTAHRQWWVDAMTRDWGEAAEAQLLANNLAPPLWLRAHAGRVTTEALAAELEALGRATADCPFAPRALRLLTPTDVRTLPAFAAGRCSVQDVAAQLAAPLLALAPGQRVLDACAAPGGKTCHMLEEQPALASLVALDVDRGRTARIEENLARLGLEARVVIGDATQPRDWWDGIPFERVLLDAPCSGTGVVRRHPDIKLLRRPDDLPAMAARQAALLTALWPLLARGGRLLYATCSVLRVENDALVTAFLAEHPDAVDITESARLILRAAPPAAGVGPGFYLLPGAADTDGFYYACLAKA